MRILTAYCLTTAFQSFRAPGWLPDSFSRILTILLALYAALPKLILRSTFSLRAIRPVTEAVVKKTTIVPTQLLSLPAPIRLAQQMPQQTDQTNRVLLVMHSRSPMSTMMFGTNTLQPATALPASAHAALQT